MGFFMMRMDHAARLVPWLETAWLQRYLERQLDADETAWFEAYLVDKPALLDRLERDTDLRDALAHAGHAEAGLHESGLPLAAAPPREQRSARRNAPAFALAASLIAGVGIGWLAQGSISGPAPPALIASPTRVVYDTERGEPTPPRVEHAGSNSPYVLIEVAVPPGAEHVRLLMDDAPAQELTASPDGFASFLVERSLLKRGPAASIAYEIGDVHAQKSLSLDTVAPSAR